MVVFDSERGAESCVAAAGATDKWDPARWRGGGGGGGGGGCTSISARASEIRDHRFDTSRGVYFLLCR